MYVHIVHYLYVYTYVEHFMCAIFIILYLRNFIHLCAVIHPFTERSHWRLTLVIEQELVMRTTYDDILITYAYISVSMQQIRTFSYVCSTMCK